MPGQEEKKRPAALNLTARSDTSSSSSSTNSLKAPRTPRFAEATAVHSPVGNGRSPFADPERGHQLADVGFGYIDNGQESSSAMPPKSPLKSAMKVPGTPGRTLQNPLSPTFREEQFLEKREKSTDKEQARDVVNFLPCFLAFYCNLGMREFTNVWACRKSRRESAWPSLHFEASTFHARSSS